MTLSEISKIMTAIEVAYPQFYKGKSESERTSALKLWHYQFASDPYELVEIAAFKLIGEMHFPPTIADVRERINEIIMPECNTGIELWEELVKAVRNSGYYSDTEFEKLSPLVKKWVKSPATLREFGMMESAVFQTVTRGQFLKSIEILMRRERETATMLPSVKQMIEQFRQKAAELEYNHET